MVTINGWLTKNCVRSEKPKTVLSHVLSWSMAEDFVLETINHFIANHQSEISPDAIVHSDQGIHYKCILFRQLLKDRKLRQSRLKLLSYGKAGVLVFGLKHYSVAQNDYARYYNSLMPVFFSTDISTHCFYGCVSTKRVVVHLVLIGVAHRFLSLYFSDLFWVIFTKSQ